MNNKIHPKCATNAICGSPKGRPCCSFSFLFGKGWVWCFFLFFSSCHKEAPIPAYIHIDKFSFSTNYSTEGSNSEKIIDAWIDVDGQPIGAFEMPCTVPVLFTGQHTVTVWPGIKENGISTTRIQYPFYNTYTQTVTLTPGSISTINPVTTYTSFSVFSFIDDFEGGATGFCDTALTDISMQIVSSPNIEMEGQCGGVVLTGNKSQYYGVTCTKFILPNTDPVFLEINYNCNAEFSVGIAAYDGLNNYLGQAIALNLRPTMDGWNKAYVKLNDAVASVGSAQYAIFFSMQKNNDPSYLYLDNVKLIH
ncbi:MAG: hypothetical protein HY840_15570 [Bacteroidetes bacterium]|nr:hypothetical protein [Bacteroidota bacterium]